jgi:hypothetical protein
MSRLHTTPVNILALASAPTTPTLNVGDVYYNTTNSTLYVYNGTSWVAAGGSGSITVSDTAPATPSVGAVWFNSTNAQTFIYYSSTWVEIGANVNASTNTLNIVQYIDGGSSSINPDIIYDAGANGATATSWTYTIDAGASVVSF